MAPRLGAGEGSNEATAGGIDVYRDVVPGFLLEIVKDLANLLHGLVVASVCGPQNYENTYTSKVSFC